MSDTTSTRATGLLPDLEDTWGRFPLPFLAALAFTAYHIIYPSRTFQLGDSAAANIGLGLSAGFLAMLSAALIAEARGLSRAGGLGVGVASGALAALLCLAGRRVDLQPWPLLCGLELVVGLAPYVPGRESNAEVWEFNHRLWIGWAMAGLAALLFGLGASAITESLRYLFGIALPSELHPRIWVLAVGLVGPLYWLSQIPRRFDEPAVMGPQTETISRMVAVLAKFIVVPLLLIYAVILHAYAIKIGLDGALPKGRLGWMVSSFAGAMAVGALISYPTHVSSGKLTSLFWRIWPWLLALPLALLLLAVGRRVGQYGLTTPRYVVLLVGAWIAAMVVSQGLLRRDLRLIPGILGALLIAASFGPWGSQGWPVRSQVAKLKARLVQLGALKQGVLAADMKFPTVSLSPIDRSVVGSVTNHLWQIDRLDALKQVFAGAADNPFDGVKTASADDRTGQAWQFRRELYERINVRLGLGADYTPGVARNNQTFFNAMAPWSIAVRGKARVLGQFNLYVAQAAQAAAGDGVAVKFDGSDVIVTHTPSARFARFEIKDNAPLLARLTEPTPAPPAKRSIVSVSRASGELAAELWIVSANLKREESGAATPTSLTVFLVLEDGAEAKAP